MRLQSIWTRACCPIVHFVTWCTISDFGREDDKYFYHPAMVHISINFSSIFKS